MANYLVHFNKNHNPKNGQFTFGDGDGDGIRDDHSNQDDSVGGKIKKAVAGYDQMRDSYRQRAMKEENYQISKEKAALEKDKIENQRNAEQNAVKTRDLDVSIMKQQARVDARNAKTQAFIDRYRAKTEMSIARAEQAEAKARMLAAKAEMRALKNADRLERQAERRAERSAERAERRAERSAIRQARIAAKSRERVYANQIADRDALIKRYNSSATKKRIGAFIAAAASPIPFAAAITIPTAIGLGVSASKDTKAVREIRSNYRNLPY